MELQQRIENLTEELARSKRKEQELMTRVEELSDFIDNASLPLHWVDARWYHYLGESSRT